MLWLAMAGFVGSTEGGMINGLLPAISDDMGVTMGQAGQVVLFASLAYAIGTPVISTLVGSIGRRRVLAGAELTFAVCALLVALSPVFGWLLGSRVLLSMGAGMVTATALATAAAISPPEQRGRAIAVIAMGQSLAVLTGVPVATWIANHLDWRLDYFLLAGMAGLAATALYFGIPRGILGDQQTMRERVSVLRNPGIVVALLTTLLFYVAAYPPIVYVGATIDASGIGRELLPYVLLANGIGAVAASRTAGRMADAFGAPRAVALAVIAQIAALLVYGAVMLAPMPLRFPLLFLSMAMIGYVGWGYWIAHASLIAHLAPTSVPLAISLDLTALNIGVAIAAAIGGVIVDGVGPVALVLVSVPLAVLALVPALWRPRVTAR
ncbi:MAG: MFS transporter [Devosia sp.]